MASYLQPQHMEDALLALAVRERVVVAGTTDYYPARVGRAPADDVLDISALDDLSRIRAEDGGWWIGALVTWTDLVEATLPSSFDGLKAAARTIGGIQIQNRGTIVGNICNASPAADGVPNLICLDAGVELASVRGRRRMGVESFVTGNRQTVRENDELVTGLFVPTPAGNVRSGFLKLGSRSSLVISIAMVAGVLVVGEGERITSARLAVGSCSPVARRLPALEDRLLGREPSPDLAGLVEAADLAPLSPIDDARGSATYRLEAAEVLLRRLVGELCA